MQERPILFNPEMAHAILNDKKKQTRRLVKGWHLQQIEEMSANGEEINFKYGCCVDDDGSTSPEGINIYFSDAPEEGCVPLGSPFGVIGDRLWVKETYMLRLAVDHLKPSRCSPKEKVYSQGYFHKHNLDPNDILPGEVGRTRPSIHMPRWASTILLEITNVRIEKLHDISEQEAKEEGVPDEYTHDARGNFTSHRQGFMNLWESIEGKGSTKANPWVWVVEFKIVEGK